MTERSLYILAHAEARRRAHAAIDASPDGYRCTLEPPKRSGDQNAALHARIQEIAERMKWAGQKQDVDTWKRLLVGAWSRAIGDPVVMLPALDGKGIEVVFRRTSTLTKGECSELLDWINAWAAEQPELEEVA